MKFFLARTVPALALALSLASCGGGGGDKATFPVTVTVNNLVETGLVMTVRGQEVAVQPEVRPATSVTFTFPNTLTYGDEYQIIPKGATLSGNTLTTTGTQPLHQTCVPSTTYPYSFLVHGTAGQLAKIQVYYDCTTNPYALGGNVTGLTTDGLILANGTYSVTVAANATTFVLPSVQYGLSYGVSVLQQPTGQNCTVSGGNGPLNNGAGTIDDAAAAASGISNVLVTCVNK